MNKENGFTLIETLLALMIGSLVLMAIYAAINSVQTSSSKIESKVAAQQDSRGALDLMAMEIQMASYNPLLKNNIWVSSTDCVSVASNQIYKGIQEAAANSITIEMDITDAAGTNTDGNGAIDGPNEIIRYNYDSTNNYITRQSRTAAACSTAPALPFLGATTANSTTQTVLVVNNAAGIPVFRYYDGQNTLLAAPVTNIGDIRKIEITLVTQTSNQDIGTGGQRQIVYTTSVVPRNHRPGPNY
ncbi:MAG TPA: prepilin-type N-terminal cleavage/methylation domain-containing protein [Smithella sp.]|nr:prepilin-type N-terminal cleavage/methylation domain-containing protein [Smithella sp.]